MPPFTSTTAPFVTKGAVVETQIPITETSTPFPTIVITKSIVESVSVTPNLTSEESANDGVHYYSFKTEFACTSQPTKEIEKFAITFSGQSVELNRLEPENMQWINQYEKISTNTYFKHSKGMVSPWFTDITVIFSEDGFAMMSSDKSGGCGTYFRTIMP
jgi:hypothetical protein